MVLLQDTADVQDSLKNTQSSKNDHSLVQLLLLAPLAMQVGHGQDFDSTFRIMSNPDTLSTIDFNTEYSIDEQLAKAINNIHDSLIKEQTEIDSDCREALYSNLWDLYS